MKIKIKLSMAAALGGTLLASCLLSSSAEATPLLFLKSDTGIVKLVGRGGGRGGGGGFSRGSGSGAFGGLSRGGGGGGRALSRGYSGGSYAYRGGGGRSFTRGYSGGRYTYGGGTKRYYGGDIGKYRDYGKRYSYRGRDHDVYKRYDRYSKYRRYGNYWYGLPYLSYGYYGGGCGWLYRRAIATGSQYWWNRYYECIGY